MLISDWSSDVCSSDLRMVSMERWRVGVDSGGTFTDICLFEEEQGRVEVWKVASTPDDPSRGIAQGVDEGLRRVSADRLIAIGFDGYAGGGLAVDRKSVAEGKRGAVRVDSGGGR